MRNWSLLARAASFLAVDLLCLGWTLWLVALTLFPNHTINRVMGTTDLDHGTFWHFADAPAVVGAVGVVALLLVALWYLHVMWLVVHTLCGSHKPVLKRRRSSAVKGANITVATAVVAPAPPAVGPSSVLTMFTRGKNRVATELLAVSNNLETRKQLNAFVKCVDVVIHWVLLVQLLEDGIPAPLVVVFASIVVLHTLIFAVVLALPYDDMGRLHILLDTFFDLLVAVGFPMLLLLHSLSVMTFDMPLMSINTRVFPPGFFERYAANVADPVQVVAVRHSLASLQVNSVLKIFTRVGMMLALVRRSTQLAWMLAEEHAGQRHQRNVYAKGHRWLSAGFVVVTVAFAMFTHQSVHTSALACEPHKECAQHAHRWLVGWHQGDLSRCPCLAIVDRDIMVSTHEQWLHPPDRTEKIAQLAAAGALQTLQLVNRALPEFPTQLRACTRLRHVSLYYTNTERLPEWFGEFGKLEYLLIEGKYPASSLIHLPENVFDAMPKLAFLHLGMHRAAHLPSLDGLTGLKSITLAGMPHLTQLPKLNALGALEQLSVVGLPGIETFPDLGGLHKLTALTLADRGAVCCNGFLGRGKCDLSRSLCGFHPLWNAPPVTQCLDEQRTASAVTRAIFDKFYTSTCAREIPPPGGIKLESTVDEITHCNGTLYRRCRVAGLEDLPAMCYNTRWMVIACNTYPFAIEMRRQQIQLGLGRPCDPVEEAWLGCGQS